jgi:membrane-associated protease RseP (regulator of RpoE activity)
MFDFGIAGPLVGLIASVAFLTIGLSVTASTDLEYQSLLPTVPTYILRSSTMGGAFIEWFIGPNSLAPGSISSSRLPLHPFAIAGFIGMLSNALALLPLGSTYRLGYAVFLPTLYPFHL